MFRTDSVRRSLTRADAGRARNAKPQVAPYPRGPSATRSPRTNHSSRRHGRVDPRANHGSLRWTRIRNFCSLDGFHQGVHRGLKAFKSGEVKEFTVTLQAARHHAVERMIENATELGANAVVGLRFDSGDVGEQQGMAEIVAYGTAVVIE